MANMDNGIFTLEYFCRLCASEGVIIHPLFPPGDDDPKHELVRMIEVLTSVPLQRPADSGAVICDKCLQLLDLFCQFREECLRQDVIIRTKRTLIEEELVRQRFQQQQQQQQQQLLCDPEPDPQQQQLMEVKLEEDDETDTRVSRQLCPGESERAAIDPASIPLVTERADWKEECSALDASKQESPVIDEDEGEHQDVELASVAPTVASCLEPTTFTSPGIALFSQAHGLSISVQVNQMSLDETVHEMTNGVPSLGFTSDVGKRRSKKATKENPGKEAHTAYESSHGRCQEAFDTTCEFDDQSFVSDRAGSTRCSLACDPCQMRFTKSYNLKRHMYEVHGELAPGLTVIECEYCGERFLRGYTLNRHIAKMHSARCKNKKKLKILAIKAKA